MALDAKSKTLILAIRATNGATWVTDQFHSNQKLGHVAKKAIDHFVDEGAMADGDYAIALLHDGEPVVLSDADKLEDAGVTENATLVLVTREPQVDG